MRMTIQKLLSVGLTAGFCALPALSGGQEWGYRGELGPDFWSSLSPDWAACGSGEVQSPVNIVTPLKTSYQLRVSYGESTGEIFNNGHTVEVEVTSGTNTLVLDGVAYTLSQFHFHSPSENRMNDRGYDMEMHLVHTSATGTNAVLAVFLKRGPSSGALGQIFAELPGIAEQNVHYEIEEAFNPENFLPQYRANHRFVGSLTTPPCTEGVQWVVLRKPVTVSDEDMAQFAAQIDFNARYAQRDVPAH